MTKAIFWILACLILPLVWAWAFVNFYRDERRRGVRSQVVV